MLTPRTQLLLDAFDDAAKSWGWEQDQGTGARVRNAEEQYAKAKLSLIRRLLYLERRTNLSLRQNENRHQPCEDRR